MDPQTYDSIDEALHGMSGWTPPIGFAHIVASRGVEILQAAPAVPRGSWPWLHAITAGVLAGTCAGIVAYLLDFLMMSMSTAGSPMAVMWIWVAFAYCVAGVAVRSTISP